MAKKKPARPARTKKPAQPKATGRAKPKTELSGSEAIRQTLATGTTKTADVITAVKEKHGLDVSISLVSAVKGKQGYTKQHRRHRAGSAGQVQAPGSDLVSITALLDAKKLVQKLGSIEKAFAVLKALDRLC
jgi:hypothetical protein